MVSCISPPASLLLHSSSPLSSGRKLLSFSYAQNTSISIYKTATFLRIQGVPQLGLSPFAQWNGLKHVGAAVFRCRVNWERKGNCKSRRGVYASLFGVGAPEALVIGVVALLVFGPKGLAEVARNLGKTVRAFQPTIRELQEVSREFKSTLQNEIGLDDVNASMPSSSLMYRTTSPMVSDSPTTSQSNSSSENRDVAVTGKADQILDSHSQVQKQQEDETGSLKNQSSDADENSKSVSPSKEAATASVTSTPPTNP